jgi:hypothetical protein
MFNKLHLFDLDAPDGSEDFRWRARSYLRMAGTVPKGPAPFPWSKRQLADLEALWLDPDAEGARDRLAGDIAQLAEKLGWRLDPEVLEDAAKHGDEYLLTVSSAAPELYVLPWEVMQVGASGAYLADYGGTLVRYAVPGLEARKPLDIPPNPGVLFAWSTAGGHVPHEEQGAAIRAAAEAGGVSFREIAQVDEASLHAALDGDPPSVLHLLCHGLPGPEGEPPRLRWGAPDRPGQITATRLARMLRPWKDAIRLVVLSACSSGDSAQDTLFMSSLAQEIHKKGIPNVVASRYPLSVRGSKVLVRALYDRMLREAWSLERALSHTRAELFRPDDRGRSHSGDAYGIQLYACDSERFVSANGVEAERPVLASYPFGNAARPVPACKPPRKKVMLETAGNPEEEQGRKRLLALLARFGEDQSLAYTGKRSARGSTLLVDTTVDGAQRLLAAWRSGDLALALGLAVLGVTAAAELAAPGEAEHSDAKNAAAAGGIGLWMTSSGFARWRKVAGAALVVAIACVGAIAAGQNRLGAGESEPDRPARETSAVSTDVRSAPKPATGLIPEVRAEPAAAAQPAPPVATDTPPAEGSPGTGGAPAIAREEAAPADASAHGGPVARPDREQEKAPDETSQGAPESAPPRDRSASQPARTAPDPAPAQRNARLSAPVLVQVDVDPRDDYSRKATISWKVPPGAGGVLVVASDRGSIRGRPAAGTAYRDGSWPDGGTVQLFPAGETSHTWHIPAEKSLWLTFWAFDESRQYSAGTPYMFDPIGPGAPADDAPSDDAPEEPESAVESE